MTDVPLLSSMKKVSCLGFPKKVLKDSRKAKVEIQENYEYAAFLLGETVNNNMYTEITAQANRTVDRFFTI